MKYSLFAILAVLLFNAPLFAAEPTAGKSASTTLVQEVRPRRIQTKLSLGPGVPVNIGLHASVGAPNIIEAEVGAGLFIDYFTAVGRLGFPWAIVGRHRSGFQLSVVPKFGVRYLRQKMSDGTSPFSVLPGDGYSTRHTYEIDALALNGVLTLEGGYRFRNKNLGLLLQVTGGANYVVKGKNHEVTIEETPTDTTITRKEMSPWKPDLRVAFALTF